jgi:hypothetical protein
MEHLYPFSTDRSSLLGTETFRNLLGEALKKSKKSVVVLSAYVKSVGVRWLQKQLQGKDIKCTIITRWTKGDLAQGSSDLECYDLAKEKKWNFKILNDLHAKVMLIDDEILFLGSPNLTGAGMSLIPVSNEEIGIKTKALDKDLQVIGKLSEEAALVNDQIIELLKAWQKTLPKIEKPKIPDFPTIVKESLKEKFNKLWVHNFPWTDIRFLLKNYDKKDQDIVHDLELFGVINANLKDLEKEIKENFLKSKIFNWLIARIKKAENQEMQYGKLSDVIHDSLLDDPKPYRQNIKLMQSNLLGYIKYFNLPNITVDVPGKKSERIKLI